MYKVVKEFRFEAGHTLDQHQGKCKNLHGHNYKVLVEMSSSVLDDMEMVKDFYNLNTFAKPLFDEFDHAFIYNTNCLDDFEKEIFMVCEKYNRKVKFLPFRSTAENMAKYFHEVLNSQIKDERVAVTKVTVYETPTSFASYSSEK